MTQKDHDTYDPTECQALGCHNKKRPGSEFCSDECQDAVYRELTNAPYGDHYAFPCFPLGEYRFAE